MNHLVQLIALFSLVFYPRKLESKMNSLFNKIYSYRIKGNFCKCGDDFLCERRIRLCNPQFIKIGRRVEVFSTSILAVHRNGETYKYGHISIGDNVTIGEGSHITSANSVIIGNNVLLGRRCTITDNSHGRTDFENMIKPPLERTIVSKGSVRICDNVWMGDNVIVLPGVTIGEGCVIGASSVISHSTPPCQ